MNPLTKTLFDFEFILTIILSSVSGLVLIYYLLPRKILSNNLKYKISRNYFNVFGAIISVVLIIICSISLFRWFYIFKEFELIENYIYLSIVIMTISLTFSIIEWAISVIQKNSFLIANQYYEKLKSTKVSTSEKHLNSFNERLSTLDYFKILFKDDLTVEEIKNELDDPKLKATLKKAASFIFVPNISIQFTIVFTSDINLKFVECYCVHGPANSPTPTRDYFLVYDEIVYIFRENPYLFKIDTFNKSKVLLEISKLISFEIKNINQKISFENEIKEGEVIIPLADFIFNNMYELMSIRQGYFTPNSYISRIFHLLFGIYKYLFLGSLISLLLKK